MSKPQSRRPPGSPRWENNIKQHLKEVEREQGTWDNLKTGDLS